MATKKAPKASDQLQKTMKASLKAYCDGDSSFFTYFTSDATVYSIGSSEPFRGVSEYKKYFDPLLRKEKRKAKVLKEDVHTLDGNAVVAQTLQIVHSGITTNVRQSVVWTHTDAGWRMNHLHTALVGSPTPTTAPGDFDTVKVLNERIATVAAILGVAQ